jgi:predicted MFS family arabinose efflux permease
MIARPRPSRRSLPRRPGDNRVLLAVGVMFFVNGAVYANWIARLPEVQIRAGLSLQGLGFLLAAAGVTGTLASVSAGHVVDRFGSRAVTVAAGLLLVAILPIIGLTTSPWVLGAVLLALALADTLTDLGMNVQAAQVNAARTKPVINRIHGVWSIGTLLGGLAASFLAASGVALSIHLSVAAALLLVAVVLAGRSLLDHDDVVADGDRPADDPRRLGAGLVLLLMLVGWFALVIEIVPAEWSTLRLSRDLGASPGLAGLGFVAFVTGMVTGRLMGDEAMHRLGVRPIMIGGLTLSVMGTMVAATVDASVAVLAGFAVAGLGTSVVYPQIYARAARIPGVRSGRGLGVMSAGMRFGVLVTPVVTGFIADRRGVGTALAIVVATAGVVLLPGIVRLLQLTSPR